MFTTFGVTFLASAATKSYILIALSRMAVCRLRGTNKWLLQGLVTVQAPFRLIAKVYPATPEEKRPTQEDGSLFLVPHVGFEPTHQSVVPELESGVSTSFTNGACR